MEGRDAVINIAQLTSTIQEYILLREFKKALGKLTSFTVMVLIQIQRKDIFGNTKAEDIL